MDIGKLVTSAAERGQSAMSVAQSLAGGSKANLKAAKAASANDSSAAASDTATITASDFMTLLVTEMKNQDPTAPTDPAQYVQQLVGVNSLQQLVEINKGITSLTSSVSQAATT